MEQMILNMSDEDMVCVVEALCEEFDYDNEKLQDETQQQFAKRMVADYIIYITDRVERFLNRKDPDYVPCDIEVT